MLNIRSASLKDSGTLLDIYAPYVLDTAVTFEYNVPSVKDFENRMAEVMKKYPYLVAEDDGAVLGFAYASPFNTRAAYDRCVETTVYVRTDFRGNGVGGKLYSALENTLLKRNFLNLYACVAVTDKEDEYLTNASLGFHLHSGFSVVGNFSKCGYKFGRWYDMVWMEKFIGHHPKTPFDVDFVSTL